MLSISIRININIYINIIIMTNLTSIMIIIIIITYILRDDLIIWTIHKKMHLRINVFLCWTIGHLAWWHLVLFLSPPEDFWYFSAKIFVFSVGVTVG